MSMSNPILSAASAGVRDPVGCRRAILSYGEILGWPALNVGPLTLKGDKSSWERATAAAQPLWLGVAWEAIERLEHEYRLDREDAARSQATRDKENVAILTWTDQKGLDVGDYPAVIDDIEETDGEYGKQFQFQFIILDAEGQETDDQIRGWCSQKWGEKTKLYKWAKAILGKRCPQPGQPLDTDKLKGRKCDLRVGQKLGKDNQMRTGIEEIYPYQTVSKASEEPSDVPF